MSFGEVGGKWVTLKYEKLANFCYQCRQLGHVEDDYDIRDDEDSKRQYGYWLRESYWSNKGKNRRVVKLFG